MSEPIRISYTRAEITEKAGEYMRTEFGPLRDKDDEAKGRYHEDLGLLIDFIIQNFPNE